MGFLCVCECAVSLCTIKRLQRCQDLCSGLPSTRMNSTNLSVVHRFTELNGALLLVFFALVGLVGFAVLVYFCDTVVNCVKEHRRLHPRRRRQGQQEAARVYELVAATGGELESQV